jgi:hypothetical protein
MTELRGVERGIDVGSGEVGSGEVGEWCKKRRRFLLRRYKVQHRSKWRGWRVNQEGTRRIYRGKEGNVRSPCDVAAQSSKRACDETRIAGLYMVSTVHYAQYVADDAARCA